MKVWTENGALTVQAETVEDVLKLVALGVEKPIAPKKPLLADIVKPKGKKKRNNGNPMPCDYCPKVLKNKAGLSMHISKMHPQAKPNPNPDELREQGVSAVRDVVEVPLRDVVDEFVGGTSNGVRQ